jgi:nitroimidazol reductase NimA-like FMN-containing flavoprotein (pyridoxamine 5'-phosphate oxidase superfamily)
MEIVKIPRMEKREYDHLIAEGYISRIAFIGKEYPYIAPFLYVFDGKFMYFLSTKYGKKRAEPCMEACGRKKHRSP